MTTILGIWAHPDDEAFVAGGFLVDAVRRGDRVVCLHMTSGEGGLLDRQPCPPETLARVRLHELNDSLAYLGVEEHRSLGYPDGYLDHVPGDDVVARIFDALVDVQPDVVLTFGHDGFTGHPDHRSLSANVTTALEVWNQPEARLCHAVVSTEWKDRFVPALNEFDVFWPGYPTTCSSPDTTLYLDDELLDAKVEALRAHTSQMKPFFDAYGDDFMRAMATTEHFLMPDRVTHRKEENDGMASPVDFEHNARAA
ncbi:MAG TPA: PIG-L family deacetylase [Actinomycetota bacterium]|nr:PIG-L family deacetylase [Actinomycetota bacterium]